MANILVLCIHAGLDALKVIVLHRLIRQCALLLLQDSLF